MLLDFPYYTSWYIQHIHDNQLVRPAQLYQLKQLPIVSVCGKTFPLVFQKILAAPVSIREKLNAIGSGQYFNK